MKEAKGIYVSHNNGKIDWKAVAEAGIQFAFAELTTAGKDQDKSFEYNFKGMKDNGITAGVYHVFRVSVPFGRQLHAITHMMHKVKFSSMEDKFLIDASTGVCTPGQTEECDNPVRYSNDRRVDKLGDLVIELMDGEYCEDVITGTSAKIWDEYYKSDTGRYFYDGPLMVIDPYLTEDKNRSPIIPKEWKDAGKSYGYWLYTTQGRIKGIEGHVSLIRKG